MTDNLYDNAFYEGQMNGSLRSAEIFIDQLSLYYLPKSVIDIGCGRGTWLKAFKDRGVKTMVGFDGPWNSQSNMIDESINFNPCDLNAFNISTDFTKFDLAMSLEVAEHLDPASCTDFIASLTNCADVVMFGAAIIGQGGKNHINEQPQSYWAKIFSSRNYVAFDIFRPAIWGNSEVEYWYQQNTFLYIRKDSDAYINMLSQSIFPITNIAFMDCIHPALLNQYRNKPEPYFVESLGVTVSAFARAIKKRF